MVTHTIVVVVVVVVENEPDRVIVGPDRAIVGLSLSSETGGCRDTDQLCRIKS